MAELYSGKMTVRLDVPGATRTPRVVRTERGVLQGDVASPILYAFAADPLIRALNSGGPPSARSLQEHMRAEHAFASQAYADDTTLFVNGPTALNRALRIVDRFSQHTGPQLNAAKTEILPASSASASLFRASHGGEGGLAVLTTTRYLGAFVAKAADPAPSPLITSISQRFNKAAAAARAWTRSSRSIADRAIGFNAIAVGLHTFMISVLPWPSLRGALARTSGARNDPLVPLARCDKVREAWAEVFTLSDGRPPRSAIMQFPAAAAHLRRVKEDHPHAEWARMQRSQAAVSMALMAMGNIVAQARLNYEDQCARDLPNKPDPPRTPITTFKDYALSSISWNRAARRPDAQPEEHAMQWYE